MGFLGTDGFKNSVAILSVGVAATAAWFSFQADSAAGQLARDFSRSKYSLETFQASIQYFNALENADTPDERSRYCTILRHLGNAEFNSAHTNRILNLLRVFIENSASYNTKFSDEETRCETQVYDQAFNAEAVLARFGDLTFDFSTPFPSDPPPSNDAVFRVVLASYQLSQCAKAWGDFGKVTAYLKDAENHYVASLYNTGRHYAIAIANSDLESNNRVLADIRDLGSQAQRAIIEAQGGKDPVPQVLVDNIAEFARAFPSTNPNWEPVLNKDQCG